MHFITAQSSTLRDARSSGEASSGRSPSPHTRHKRNRSVRSSIGSAFQRDEQQHTSSATSGAGDSISCRCSPGNTLRTCGVFSLVNWMSPYVLDELLVGGELTVTPRQLSVTHHVEVTLCVYILSLDNTV